MVKINNLICRKEAAPYPVLKNFVYTYELVVRVFL